MSCYKGALKPGLDADLVVYADNPVKDAQRLSSNFEPGQVPDFTLVRGRD